MPSRVAEAAHKAAYIVKNASSLGWGTDSASTAGPMDCNVYCRLPQPRRIFDYFTITETSRGEHLPDLLS